MTDKSILFTPTTLGRLSIPGRLVRSATELFCSYPDGHVHPAEFAVYRRLGEQPLGLIITAHTCVSPEGRSNPYQNALWDDAYLPDTEKIAQAAQRNGIPALMQLGHGGMKAEGNNGGLPVLTPDNMTEEQIRAVIRAFGEAALRAKRAGMKGVMLHGAHLYLLSQFFYPRFNHRTDAWGGTALNRFRIVREAAEEIRKTCGGDYPLLLKINGDDEGGTEDYHLDLVEALRSVSGLMDAVEISGWHSAPGGRATRPYFLDNVRRLRQEIDTPLIEVGGFRSAEGMLEALEAGASAVSMSRPLLREPDFPTKLRDIDGAVSPCTGCGFCYRPYDEKTGVRCPHAGPILP